MLSLDRQNAYRERLRALQPGWRPATQVYEELVRQALRPDVRVLDAGCGRGGAVEQIGTGAAQVVGIDPDLLSLHEHRLTLDAMPRVSGLLHQLPLASDSFDLVISSWVLEHLDQPQAAFAEIARVLVPGGNLIVMTPNKLHPMAVLNRLMAPLVQLQDWLVPRLYGRAKEDAFPVTYRANTPARLSQLAQAVGLRPLLFRTISDPTYLAFNDSLFAFSRVLERLLPASCGVHIVASFVRV